MLLTFIGLEIQCMQRCSLKLISTYFDWALRNCSLSLYRSDKKYLVWKWDVPDVSQKSRIWLRQVEENGIDFVKNSDPILLLEASGSSAYDWNVVEGPSLLWNSELGYYYLIYSANFYGNQHYHVGVARSRKVRE